MEEEEAEEQACSRLCRAVMEVLGHRDLRSGD